MTLSLAGGGVVEEKRDGGLGVLGLKEQERAPLSSGASLSFPLADHLNE